MPHKNGFKTVHTPLSEDKKELLVYMDARDISLYNKERSEYLDFFHQEKLAGLAFENQIYYPFKDLEILKQYPFIEELWIGQINIKDLSGVKHIEKLKGLCITDNTAAFDFNLLKDSLENTAFTWHRKLSNINVLRKLKVLHLERDNDDVVLPPNIEDLEIRKSQRTNLDFLENHLSLQEIKLNSNRKLENIGGLVNLSDSLEKLQIEKCKNITDYTPLLKLTKLTYLRISAYDKARKEELRKLQPLLRKQIEEVIIYPLLK